VELIEGLTNPFYTPLGHVLIKGVEEDGKWIVYLQASNELKDRDGETVEMEALKKAADFYLSHGVISWDHQHKLTRDPGFIIGEPMDVRFTPKGETLVKGFLYKFNDIAQKVWKNIQSGARVLGASIGGGILHKAIDRVRRVIWDETALTHKPVNDGTLGNVQIVPFAAFAKALTAGGGVDATSFIGGRALTYESLQGNTSNVLPGMGSVTSKDLRSLFSELLKAMRAKKIMSYNDMLNFVLDSGFEGDTAIQIVNYLARKIPEVVGAGR
jgi:hypothetical protein